MDTIVCVASGPSLTHADVSYCRGKARVLVVNNGFQIAPWADWLWACDYKWWLRYSAETLSFSGDRWTLDEQAAQRFGLRLAKGYEGTQIRFDGVSWGGTIAGRGGNGGFQGLNLAVHFNPKRIVLLGYDMKGPSHWHPDHDNGMGNPLDFNFPHWRDGFDAAAPQLAELGIEVVNCSRDTALTCFKRSTIEDVL